MAKTHLDQSQEARRLFDQADTILGFPLTKTMLEGPDERLRDTSVTQPALFLASAMALEALKERHLTPSLAAGHSLGEYSALYAAHVLSFPDALMLVHERGKAMRDAGQQSDGTMAAILGLDPNKITDICKKISETHGVCAPANFNSAGQTVIAGRLEAVKKAVEETAAAGAVKAVMLNVSGAFHTTLMSPAVERLKPLIEKTTFRDADIPVVTNVDAVLTTKAEEFKRKLIAQIDHPVLWDATMTCLLSQPAGFFIEVGAGKVLAMLMKKRDRQKSVFWTDDMETLEKGIALTTPG